jgi:putative chitobiose transport system permease protein
LRKKYAKKRLSRSWYGDGLIFLMLAAIGIFMALPMYLNVINAFKPLDEFFVFPPRFYVVHPTLDSFRSLGQLVSSLWVPFSRYVFNSIFISIVVTAGHIIIASMAAYPLAKHKFFGGKAIFTLIMWALLFTGGTIEIPRYVVMAKLGMINTYWSVILPPIAGTVGLFLMRQFMLTIPDTMLEAARIDGANEFMIYWKMVMPNVKPAWLTLLIFAFNDIWKVTGTHFVYTEALKPLPQALQQITAGGIARQGVGAAIGLIMMIPPIVIFIITQSNIMETMAHSGMKD